MEFHENNRVVVNPLRIKPAVLRELEYHLLLFYTQTRRENRPKSSKPKSQFREQGRTRTGGHAPPERTGLPNEGSHPERGVI